MKNNITTLNTTPRFMSAEEPDFLAHRVNQYYRERVQNTWSGGHIMHGKIPSASSIHLNSNDYLSISKHPEIIKQTAQCMLDEGNGILMSGVFLHGEQNPQLALEQRLAHFMHSESGILCQSGWCANTGLIQSIANQYTPVYVDIFAHASLWEGVRSAGASGIMFHHNDPGHLERQILKHGPGVVVVDSVYSTNGSICPLRDVVRIAEEQGCVIIVDESHSLGTHGPHGEGLVATLGLANKVHFRTASLAKAFAGRAGFIACSKRLADYFKYESLPSIFSSTLLPYDVAALNTTLDIIYRDDWRRVKLQENASYIRQNLDELGYNLNGSQTQIVSLEAGAEQQTIILRDALEARDVFGAVFCAPATPKNRSLVRLSLHCDLTEEQLKHVVEVCATIRNEVDLSNWPSTRRKRTQKPNVPNTAEVILATVS